MNALSSRATELTLARVEEQLSATQAQVLAQRKTIADLTTANSRLEHYNNELKLVVEESRRRESATIISQRETQFALRQAIEERNMSDHVVHEYANLVKSLDAKSSSKSRSSLSTIPPSDDPIELTIPPNVNGSSSESVASRQTPLSLMVEGRQGLQRLVQEMSAETTRLHEELQRLHAQLETTKAELTALKFAGDDERSLLSAVRSELMQHQADDAAAAKLVSRYM